MRAASAQAAGTSWATGTGPAAPTRDRAQPAKPAGQLSGRLRARPRRARGRPRGRHAPRRWNPARPQRGRRAAACGAACRRPRRATSTACGRVGSTPCAGPGPARALGSPRPLTRSATRSVRTRCSASAAVRSKSRTRAVTTAARSTRAPVGVVEAPTPPSTRTAQRGQGRLDADGPLVAAGVVRQPAGRAGLGARPGGRPGRRGAVLVRVRRREMLRHLALGAEQHHPAAEQVAERPW